MARGYPPRVRKPGSKILRPENSRGCGVVAAPSRGDDRAVENSSFRQLGAELHVEGELLINEVPKARRDHIGGRTGSRDLGVVSRRIIFQEGADHEIRGLREAS
jgi:hypothetical protein